MAKQQVYLELANGDVVPAKGTVKDGPRDGIWFRAIEVDGVLYHHVSETKDGDWIYRKAYTT
jgi:hypothetical protein